MMTTEDAEAIAAVVADMRAKQLVSTVPAEPALFTKAKSLICDPVTVDATAIYNSLVENSRSVYLYEDHPCIAPPWTEAAIAYRNEHGNVIVMHANTIPFDRSIPGLNKPANKVEWDRVKWLLRTFVWIGGKDGIGRNIETGGPMHMWQFLVYDDGGPADLGWVHLVEKYPMQNWDMANLVLLGALNYMNCRNIELVVPARPRPARRRLERTGVTVHTINVFPAGRTTRGPRGEPVGGTPLTSVRGHFAKYGPEYDRGLLFGKYSGRFWIAQHARGSTDDGESRHDYRLVPDDG